MNHKESSELAKKLELQVKWVWWDFQPKHVFEGPYWYVEAVNKINGKKHKLWRDGDEKALFGSTVHTGNINSPEEACVYLVGKVDQLGGVEKNEKSMIADTPPMEDGVEFSNLSIIQQVEELGSFILSLDCGYPTANEEFPNGMSVTEAATEYIKELRTNLKMLEDEKKAHVDSVKPQMKGE